MRRPIEEFLKRLTDIADYRGTPFGRTRLILESEHEHSEAITRFNGYLTLSDAFKCFFLETIELLNTEARPKVREPVPQMYGFLVARLGNSFLALCGAERISIKGYPYQGYSLLRNVYDNLLLNSAVLQGMTDFYSVEGIKPDEENLDRAAIRKLRMKTEYAVRRQMTGSESRLSQETQEEVAFWDAMFDMETHGARLSATHAKEFLRGEKPLRIVPTYDDRGWVLFMNRYCEVAWMLHRLLPTAQPPNVSLVEPWPNSWKILDESFLETVIALTEEQGKPIGKALVELVETKFPFAPERQCPL